MPTRIKDLKPARIEEVAPEATEPQAQTDRDSLKLYLNEIGKTPLLKIEEEIKLAARVRKGDEAARQHMIRANLRLVVRIALDYRDFGLTLQDLISEGNIGLIKAVDRYDPTKGGKLSTYAAWWIKQSIQRALANQSKTIRLPVHAVSKISQIRKTARALSDKLGHEVTDEELAAELSMPLEKLIHLRSVAVHPASLDAPLGDSSDSSLLGDVVRDDAASSPSDSLGSKNVSADLANAISSLGEREAQIIRMRFGLDGNDEMTLEEIGKKFNVTRERIRQLEQLSIKHMRRLMETRDNQRTSEELEEDRIQKGRMEVVNQFIQSKKLATAAN